MPTTHALIVTVAMLSLLLSSAAGAQEQPATSQPVPNCTVTFVVAKEIDAKLTRQRLDDGCTWTFIDENEHSRGQWESWPLFGIRVDAVNIKAGDVKGDVRPEPAARRTPATALQFVPTGTSWPEDIVQGPGAGIKSLTTALSPRPALFVWSNLSGNLTIGSDDSTTPIEVTIKIDRLTDARSRNDDKSLDEWAPADWQNLLRAGYSVTMNIAPRTYQTLMEFARCVQVGPDESACLKELRQTWQRTQPDPTAWQRFVTNGSPASLEYSSDKDAVTAGVYHLISRWLGRDPAFDFTNSKGEKRARPSKSEPIVLFAGIAGLNKTAILDCQHQSEQAVTGGSKYVRCSDFARPSAQTLERARYFWAIYVEDADAPFDTTIEVEFGATARNPDYEEFDPRVVPVVSPSQELPRSVRIGFRRFRIREAPSVAQVAFTRQGPSYGVRQWVRVYRQRSQWWALPAGTLLVPAFTVERRTIILVNTPPPGGVGPNVATIQEQPKERLLFAAASVQWPQLRAKADDSVGWHRLWYNLPPDVTAGLADTNIFFVGGSWPIPVWRDRTYLTLGMTAVGNDVLKNGYAIGQQLPLSTTREEVVAEDKDWDFGFRIAISIELFKIRR